ncbi:MAG: hypothetical protein GF350_12200, partial [Chitinivibrionales bacterium]|nr:hypothetical protein [Chitinivibrionales bacterium]
MTGYRNVLFRSACLLVVLAGACFCQTREDTGRELDLKEVRRLAGSSGEENDSIERKSPD